MKYKIDFGLTFLLCILIMIFGQVWTFLGNFPEAFPYGNIVYNVVVVIFFIFTNLSIGVAAAIIFYFMSQFLDKNRNFEMYSDLRSDILRILYDLMKIVSEVNQFKELKLIQKERRINWFQHTDVPILIKHFREIDSEEKKLVLKKDLMTYLSGLSDEKMNETILNLEKHIEKLEEKKNIRYFKESRDLIESLTGNFGDGDFSLDFSLYIGEENKINKNAYLENLANGYYDVLDSSINLYEELEEFIISIEKKKIIKFIKMLD
ncbi:hypothetical protein P4658_27250 [Priestia megaterium]|uniref:hypothetical protein n=1 Tax=Priestia megaterium TaxID=1404 RepID=UPI002E24470C|nr:hypothetical protein [Priestia megaterium]